MEVGRGLAGAYYPRVEPGPEEEAAGEARLAELRGHWERARLAGDEAAAREAAEMALALTLWRAPRAPRPPRAGAMPDLPPGDSAGSAGMKVAK
jgi:hypothetical protein